MEVYAPCEGGEDGVAETHSRLHLDLGKLHGATPRGSIAGNRHCYGTKCAPRGSLATPLHREGVAGSSGARCAA